MTTPCTGFDKQHYNKYEPLFGDYRCMTCGMTVADQKAEIAKEKAAEAQKAELAKAAESKVPGTSTRQRADDERAAKIAACGEREQGHRMYMQYGRLICEDCGATTLDIPRKSEP